MVAARVEAVLVSEPTLLITGPIAEWLEANTAVDKLRVSGAFANTDMQVTLARIHMLAEWSRQQMSEDGHPPAPKPDIARPSKRHSFQDSASAGHSLGLDPRTITRLCTQGVLEAERVGGRWLINSDSIDKYRRTRERH